MSESTAVATVGQGPLPSVMEGGGAVSRMDPTLAFLSNMKERVELATMLAHSGMTPYREPEKVLAVMLAGHEMGLSVMASLKNIHPIPAEGGGMRLTTSADLALALASDRYGVVHDILESTMEVCRIEFNRPGRKPFVAEFLLEEARRAGLTDKKNWKNWQRDMLVARCKFRGVRVICPEVAAGLYDADELGGITNAAGEPIVDAEWSYIPSAEYGSAPAPQTSTSAASPNASRFTGAVCPVDAKHGAMWDNRARNAEKRAQGVAKPGPDWKCKNKECKGCFWLGQLAEDELLAEIERTATALGESAVKYVQPFLFEKPRMKADVAQGLLDKLKERLAAEATPAAPAPEYAGDPLGPDPEPAADADDLLQSLIDEESDPFADFERATG